ncbi:MAG: 3-methyl-2-oxobutanoate hydroxymethyltransferase [candidate division WOR-3 bacterium]
MKITVPHIVSMKGKEKIVALTAYDFTFARLLDEAGIDVILVGDSAAMTVHGHPNTLAISLDEMLAHTRAVARGVKNALLVGDMPFGSYQSSAEEGIRSAIAFLKAGAEAVKIEGGKEIAPLVRELTRMGIPVMGHVGMLPQRVHAYGGFKLQKDRAIIEDAKAISEAGAFSLVLEKIPTALAKEITETVPVPTIGIGAGPHCDGQVLVLYDMLGLNPEFRPRFLKRYVDGWGILKKAVEDYAKEVREGLYPDEEHSF